MNAVSIIELITSLLSGLRVTVTVAFFGIVLAFFLSFAAGFGRLSKYKIVRVVATVYAEVIRGTSLLVQLFWIYFALPIIGIRLSAMMAGILALGLNGGAYGSEVVRSSINSIPVGQTEASIALNLTPRRRMWRIILPQAFVQMLPGFGNLQIEILKGTALVSLITLGDLTYRANVLNASTMQTTTIFVILLAMYYLIAWPLTRGVEALEKKMKVGRY
ncbi:ectoine/hydroxyectoine ABC transporter permease subunit EhuC [Alkalibacter rhizosphaerae]|uniref:Ectoine/hydroxyectoine ABC transporter permease subunit EhuC n=1 Tax=Alkalibacter rhizosphaerae TaxID=2815577 RepID=A0A974XEL9_9FIRM|nr:ectoine/hydroxyectoine ABC transporter permease subunit EhuC [Alkalibacter rhizosphaerae]QSX08442.1 ectoine/hydroxyectoine ABC transporter permease subunit EhuC [Alkalibacter rhizosphaerae]